MPSYADRVKETTTTVGTGSIALAGAASGFQSFATAFGSVAPIVVGYAIVGGTEWEVGKGTFNGTSTLTRDTIRSSSNGGSVVTFSAGTKDVFVTPSAENLDNINTGIQLAQVNGWALP